MHTPSHCTPQLRAFDLGANNNNNYYSNHATIGQRLGRANSQRAAQLMPRAFLLPPSLTLGHIGSGLTSRKSVDGNNNNNHRRKPPGGDRKRNADFVTDALYVLRSSKRPKHSDRDRLRQRNDDENDDDGDASRASRSEESDASDESDSSVGSVENHHPHPTRSSDHHRASKKNGGGVSGGRRRDHAANDTVPSLFSSFSANTMAYMDSHLDWTIGILPPQRGSAARTPVRPFPEQHPGAIGRGGLTEPTVGTPPGPEGLETPPERRVGPHHRTDTAGTTKNRR